MIRELADQGTAVIAISSDNEELVGLCDRVIVMAEGRVTGELRGSGITVDTSFTSASAARRPRHGQECA